MVQNVSAGQPQQKPRRGGTFLNALGQTALTASVGAAGGAGVSALASVVIPPKPEKIFAQYKDAFLQAAGDESGANTLRNLVSNSSPDTFEYAKEIFPKVKASNGAEIIYSMSEDAVAKLGEEQFKQIGLSGASYTRQAAIEELGGKVGVEKKAELKETVEAIGKKANEAYEGFVAKAQETFKDLSKDNELYKLSKKSAKSATRKVMVGKGIRIGIVVALLGSIILSFVASKKAQKQAQQVAAMEEAAKNQAQSAQEQPQITPEQAQILAYMAQQQNAAAQSAAPTQNAAAEINPQNAMSQIKPLQAQQIAQMQMPQAQMQMPPQMPPQIELTQTAQNSAAQYFKTPMQSPLV